MRTSVENLLPVSVTFDITPEELLAGQHFHDDSRKCAEALAFKRALHSIEGGWYVEVGPSHTTAKFVFGDIRGVWCARYRCELAWDGTDKLQPITATMTRISEAWNALEDDDYEPTRTTAEALEDCFPGWSEEEIEITAQQIDELC